MNKIKEEELLKYKNELEKKRKFSRVIGVRPTGWAKETSVVHSKNSIVSVIHTPYSEHSSYAELEDFIRDVKKIQGNIPEIISTVPGTKAKDLQHLLSECKER